MTIGRYILFAFLIVIAGILVYAIQIPLRRSEKKWLRIIVFLLKAFFVVLLAYLLISTASPLLWHTGYILAALYIALLADVAVEAVFVVVPKKELYKYAAAAVTVLFALYGIINMEVIKPKYHEYHSEKLQNSYKVIFVSDLHYGSSQSRKTVWNAFEKIAAEEPDYLLLGGDLVDEHTTKEEMQDVFAMIGKTGIKTYYIYGNHDRQERGDYLSGKNYTEKELEETILNNGIHILYNSFEQVEPDLVLLGMEDPSHPDTRAKVSDLPARPEDAYVICLDHTPYQNEDIAEMNADLQLSGHTHAGQLFPLRYVYHLIGLNVYGEYEIDDTDLFVSAGIAGWYLPLRNEAHCNYEVIRLTPANP